jgi:putative N6-adenine-specific DNA methylase
VRIQAHLTERDFALYLDTTGEPLFKRGLRVSTGEAPLRENLAAGVLRLAGWRPGITLFDPMCGSGTFVLEAALAALDIAPGLGRRFAFEKLSNFDPSKWRGLRQSAAARQKPKQALPIYASDLSRDAIRAARTNLKSCGLEGVVTLNRADVLEISPPASEGIIVTNPPYGVRLGEQQALAEFYPRLGDALKQRFSGWSAYILSADMRLPKLIRLAVSRRLPLYNGALECRLFEYRMVSGKMAPSKPRLPQQPASV